MTTTIYTLPAQLRATAAAWAKSMPDTQRERQAVIRALKDRAGISLTDARLACESAATDARGERADRTARRAAEHGADPRMRAGCTPRPPKMQARMRHTYTLREALTRLRQAAALAAYRSAYRVPGTNHGDENVALTDDPAKVGIDQTQETDWNLYRGSYKGWAATVTNTTITIPTDWRIRVQRQGLAVVDGMMTLDAGRIEGAPEGVDLFAATWGEQGRGYTVTVQRGYIARQGATAYHGATPDKALAGLRRKLAGAEWAAKLRAADLSALMGRLTDADLDGATVRISDARAIGACEYGIRSWCHDTGLPYETGAASLRQVWAAYQTQPRTEARAAILHAMRRQRRLAA